MPTAETLQDIKDVTDDLADVTDDLTGGLAGVTGDADDPVIEDESGSHVLALTACAIAALF
jgi:hypothetical protein